MPEYKLMIRYDNYVVYDNYDSRLQKIIETKFGVLGATNIQPCFMNPSLPLLLITSFHAPASIPLSELKNVVLEEGIAIDVQPVEEYNRLSLG
ncbi:uncharacterized protein EURHEDRAFT_381254 [Aspergillus ruber CBS 135680]|uniref:Uncharacterized protein n=1 Tax=Aspergillus ruber (strain CBS 135680) TaxID=1388766 RepID=A0A017S3J5_ASPRC|nr:uncharacterized protein EURHEDRAFT_381254 [Aspergillus ruber CBS 135680]EYE91204.1 hypothetical protein EURHEDRAFT_381254 [Aspergillus ruber CBS 135680]